MSTEIKQKKLLFPEWLRLRREIANLNQSDIAKALGVTTQAVSTWEKGKAQPSLTPYQTQQLCLILGITFDELVKGFNEETEIYIN